VALFEGTGPLFRRSAIPKVHCADIHATVLTFRLRLGLRLGLGLGLGFGLGSALGLGLGLVGIVDFRSSGPSK